MTSAPTPEQRATYREVLADRRFRLLFVTRILTVSADSLRIVTLSTLVFAATGSPLFGALAFGIGFLPQVAGSLLLGALADRARPRRVITVGYGIQCAAAAVMGATHLSVAAILFLIAAVAFTTPAVSGASNRLIAERLTGDAYVLGRSLSNMSVSAAQLAGLAAGGAAVGFLGPHRALLVSAGVYLAAAAAVRLQLPDLPPAQQTVGHESRQANGSLLRLSWSGNTKLLAEPRVRTLLFAQWVPPALVAGAESLVVPFTSSHRMPAGSAGLLLACLPLGMFVGDLAIGRFLGPAARERLVAPLIVVLGLPLVCFALEPSRVVGAALLLVSGTGFAYALGLQRPFLEAVPEARRGQAFALLTAGLMSVQGVGPVLFGAVAEFTGSGDAMALAGLATVCMAAWLVIK